MRKHRASSEELDMREEWKDELRELTNNASIDFKARGEVPQETTDRINQLVQRLRSQSGD